MERITLLIVLTFTLHFSALADQGTIRGTVIDDDTGETLFGVNVVVAGTTTGSVTDFDGKFELKLEPGSYDLQVSFVSYKKLTIEGVEVNDNEVTLLETIRLAEDVAELQEVVITADVVKSTEAAINTIKKKSPNVLDGISSASFRKIGDSDAAAAAQRITGVSIQGGKYVFVRGLGDRYSRTLLNGMDVPGLDPDQNALQIDLFPTNILNSIVVSKSFTADLPADFTGGMVDIETKDIPDVKSMNAQVGLGFIPGMHFNDDYVTYEGSSTDWLGMDDGQRELPFSDGELVKSDGTVRIRSEPSSNDGQIFAAQLRSFDRTLTAMRERSFMDYNLSFSYGNQFDLGNKTAGFTAAITYRNETRFYEDAIYGRYGRPNDQSITQIELRELQQGDQGENSALLSGMVGFSLKGANSKYKLNVLRIQNGEKRAAIFGYLGQDEGSDFVSFQHNLEYTQRELTNVLLSGEYFIGADKKWNLEWNLSPTFSVIDEPDIRFTRYEIRGLQFEDVDDVSDIDELIGRPGTELSITTEGGFPERIWRDLDEVNYSGTVDVTRDLNWFQRDARLRFGVRNTYKQRDYAIRRNQIFVDPAISLTGNPDELFFEENLWYTGNAFYLASGSGNYFQADYAPVNANSFESTINNLAGYVSAEFRPFESLRAIVGVRVENYVQNYTGTNQLGTIVLDNDEVINEFRPYPTLNLIYSLTEDKKLRFSYSRTTARFSFKEASFAEIFDPITGRTFIGSLNPIEDGEEVLWNGEIESTLIDNFDARYEIFGQRGQLISFSGFYKRFYNAIELVQIATADNNFQVQNVGDAEVLGGEIEIRQSLKFISPGIENFTLSGNVSVIHSSIEMSETEFKTRVNDAREGETIDRTRQLQGQAPYIVNAGLGYSGLENGIEAGLFYNVQGETLSITGAADKPDVFTVPFHSLNFNFNKNFGVEEKFRVGFMITNLLNDRREQVFESFQSTNEFFQSLNPGRRFKVRFVYRIF